MEITIQLALAGLLGYLFGSVPWSLIIGKVFYKKDIRKEGSGNLGASNAGRVLGKEAGLAVAILDASKGLLAMLLINWLVNTDAAILAGVGAAVGHCYPIFAQFKGGKAVSTAAGYLIGVSIFVENNGVWLVLIPMVVFFGLLKWQKMVSLASLTATTVAAILIYFLQDNVYYAISLSVIAAIVIARHHENIGRILNKSERKISWM